MKVLLFVCLLLCVSGTQALVRANRVLTINVTIDFASVPNAPDSLPVWSPPNGKAYRVVGWYTPDDQYHNQIEATAGSYTEGEVSDWYEYSNNGGDPYYFILGNGVNVDAIIQGPWWGNGNLGYSLTEGSHYPLDQNGYDIRMYPYQSDLPRVARIFGLREFATFASYDPEATLWGLDDGLLHGSGWVVAPSMTVSMDKQYVPYTISSPLVVQRVNTGSVSAGSPSGSISIVLEVAVVPQ